VLNQDVKIPVPQPGAPDEQDVVSFGDKLAAFLIDHPMPIAALVLTMLVAAAWKTPKLRGIMIAVLAVFLGVWLAKEGIIG
jgi:hypothetical protein